MASPYVKVRIGNNPVTPYEVVVGTMVRMFDNKKEAFRFALRENKELIKEDVKKLEKQIRDLEWVEGEELLFDEL